MAVAKGFYHSLALGINGEVYGWGHNNHGQLGEGNSSSIDSPRLIKGIPGKVFCITAGDYHSLALMENGKVYGWGGNEYGQLGDGTKKDRRNPKLIKGIPGKVVGIAAGSLHSLVVTENGELYGWGRNQNGELGDGSIEDRKYPKLIKGIRGKVTSIAAGFQHSVALLESGKVYGWGGNDNRQQGNGTIRDRKLPKLIKYIPGKVTGIAVGIFHTVALLESGKVYGWGGNAFGQLGDKTLADRDRPKLIKGFTTKVTSIAAGEYESLALLENGELYGWGRNAHFELGRDLTDTILFPKIDKSILRLSFAKGGRIVGFNELEVKLRQLIGQEIHL